MESKLLYLVHRYVDACAADGDINAAENAVKEQYLAETGVQVAGLGCYHHGVAGEYHGCHVYLWGADGNLIETVMM